MVILIIIISKKDRKKLNKFHQISSNGFWLEMQDKDENLIFVTFNFPITF